MKGISKYGAVATKIRGMRSHLLTTEDYYRLANCTSVRDVATTLKAHPSYSEVLADLDPDNMRRETFERMILRSIFRDFAKISHFLDRKHKELLTVYSTQYEIRLINNVIRTIMNRHETSSDMTVYRYMYESSPNFHFDSVVKSQNMDDLMKALEGSIYQEPLLRIKKEIADPTLFDYETAFMRFYFDYFWKALLKIDDKNDKDTLLDIHGMEIDLLNLIWIYRAKTYYDIGAKEIYSFLIPAYHNLKPRQVSQMITAGSKTELLNMMSATKYKKYIDPQDASSLERAYVEQVAIANDKARKNNPYSFAVIGAYAFDKKLEVDRIVKIAESVRYGYDPKLIIDALNIRGNRQ